MGWVSSSRSAAFHRQNTPPNSLYFNTMKCTSSITLYSFPSIPASLQTQTSITARLLGLFLCTLQQKQDREKNPISFTFTRAFSFLREFLSNHTSFSRQKLCSASNTLFSTSSRTFHPPQITCLNIVIISMNTNRANGTAIVHSSVPMEDRPFVKDFLAKTKLQPLYRWSDSARAVVVGFSDSVGIENLAPQQANIVKEAQSRGWNVLYSHRMKHLLLQQQQQKPSSSSSSTSRSRSAAASSSTPVALQLNGSRKRGLAAMNAALSQSLPPPKHVSPSVVPPPAAQSSTAPTTPTLRSSSSKSSSRRSTLVVSVEDLSGKYKKIGGAVSGPSVKTPKQHQTSSRRQAATPTAMSPPAKRPTNTPNTSNAKEGESRPSRPSRTSRASRLSNITSLATPNASANPSPTQTPVKAVPPPPPTLLPTAVASSTTVTAEPTQPAVLWMEGMRDGKKVHGYCECCSTHFADQVQHVLSAKHRKFASTPSNYLELDAFFADLPTPSFLSAPVPDTDHVMEDADADANQQSSHDSPCSHDMDLSEIPDSTAELVPQAPHPASASASATVAATTANTNHSPRVDADLVGVDGSSSLFQGGSFSVVLNRQSALPLSSSSPSGGLYSVTIAKPLPLSPITASSPLKRKSDLGSPLRRSKRVRTSGGTPGKSGSFKTPPRPTSLRAVRFSSPVDQQGV